MKKTLIIGLMLVLMSVAMAADVKVSALPSATTVNDADLLYLVQTTSKKVAASVLQTYVLDGVTIGDTTSTSITTNNGTQTMTNKRLTSPKINENVALTATATELNKMDGVTASTAEINCIDGVTSNLQTQLNAIESPAAQAYIAYQYESTWVQSGTTKDITESTILTALGNPGGKVLSPTVDIILWTITTGTYTKDASGSAKYVIGSTGVNHLSEINLTGLTNGVNYAIVVTFRLIADGL
jgi:hypothetical protein